MSTIAVTLTEPLADYVDHSIQSGRSSDPSQVVQKALRVLQAVETRRTAFHAAIQEGLDDIERGNFEDIDDLDLWFLELRNSWRT